jgi:hypothetical protein
MATLPFRPLLIPRARDARRKPPAILDTDLDAAQRAAVMLPAGRALLVLGEAGHGKTTVAVHRFAHLWRSSACPLRAAVVVPTAGLARLVQSLLRRLGADVEAQTYEAWAKAEARRAFRDLPRRESELLAPSVARVKRHPALRAALAELACRPAGRINDDVDARPVRSRALARRADLQHLFGDRALLGSSLRDTPGITARMIEDTLDHTRIQFSPRAEREWSHVTDKKRLVAVDGRPLDEGTGNADAATVDAEDYAVLFELDRLRAARLGAAAAEPRAYDLVLLDEAQELSELELVLIGRSIANGGTLIVGGDADQQTDSTTTFAGWESVMRSLGREDYAVARLEIGYRCPPEIATFARAIRKPERTGTVSASAERIFAVPFSDETALVQSLAQDITSFARRDRRASIAIVCRSPLLARSLASALRRREIPARLVFDGAFLARGPVQLTTVEETKGLEFDVVIVPDASATVYPEAPDSRRALYVAITRARHQVLLAYIGTPTPLLPPNHRRV